MGDQVVECVCVGLWAACACVYVCTCVRVYVDNFILHCMSVSLNWEHISVSWCVLM